MNCMKSISTMPPKWPNVASGPFQTMNATGNKRKARATAMTHLVKSFATT